jgi:CBS domain-containing protein
VVVKEVMRQVPALSADATLSDVVRAIGTTGCEAIPILATPNANSELVVSQLVCLRDLPKLRKIEASAERGHAVGHTALELLEAIGRQPGRFPTVSPRATLADAWGLMAESCTPHLPVVDQDELVGMVSLVVSFAEFPNRSPAAGFWP